MYVNQYNTIIFFVGEKAHYQCSEGFYKKIESNIHAGRLRTATNDGIAGNSKWKAWISCRCPVTMTMTGGSSEIWQIGLRL